MTSLRMRQKTPTHQPRSSFKAPVTTKRIRFKDSLQVNPPPNSFAATQRKRPSPSHTIDSATDCLDRERSGQEVERLLRIRRQLMRNARNAGDDLEVRRLQTLGLFDSVYNDALQKSSTGCEGRVYESPVVERESDDQSDSSSTAKSCRTVVSSRSSIPHEEEPLDHGKISAEADDSIEEVDLFLEIAMEALHQPRPASSRTSRSDQYGGRCRCPCCKGDKACAKYVRGQGCCPPYLQPEIIAAKQRVAYFEQSPITIQLRQDLGLMANCKSGFYQTVAPEIEAVKQRIDIARQSIVVKQLELDRAFVETYDIEIEARCTNGIWWEGWLVVKELRRRGIVGSVSLLERTSG